MSLKQHTMEDSEYAKLMNISHYIGVPAKLIIATNRYSLDEFMRGYYSNGSPKEQIEAKSEIIIPETTEHETSNDDPACCICMGSTVECAIMPCGHQCACAKCLSKLVKCPECQQKIKRVIHLPY